MPITQSLSSKGNVKKFTNNDITPQLDQPTIASYYATSTAGQTIITLPFYINTTATSYTDNLWLFIDGKKLNLGASNDYTFTNIGSDGNSNQVTLTSSIPSGLNIQALKMGLKPEITFQMDNRIITIQNTIVTAPTVTRLLSGSGTYTTPAGAVWLKVKMVGGGGGGGGSGTGNTGGTTTFGTSLLTCTGGGGGGGGSGGGDPSSGGSATVNSPAIAVVAMTGSQGGGSELQGSATFIQGGQGGASPFGGNGGGGNGNGGGGSAAANSGSGGGGSGSRNANTSGAGGASGGYIEAIIPSPAATYAYSVGTNGTASSPGGDGGTGIIIVEEYYVG